MQVTRVLLTSFAIISSSTYILAQANVTENETTRVYVDANTGSDANPGTQASPFRTIGKGSSKADLNNASGIGTRVLVNPGTYREFLSIHASSKHTAAPITIEATKTGTAIVAASDVLAGWANGSTPSTYTHAWPHKFGQCAVPSGWPSGIMPIVLRTEMFFVNGTPLTQVLSLSLMREGTFLVDESASVVHIWPAVGTNMSTAVVEAAVRPATLSVSGRSNMVIRGLVFEHAATCINHTGANIDGSTNVLIDSVQANWNNWGGLGIHSSSQITLKNSVANYNGGVGFSAFRARTSLAQFDETDYNNWRGAMGALYDWGMGGFKFFAAHGVIADQIYAYHNQAQGLWFDTDDKDITISNARLGGNVLANLQLEQNQGPISLTNSILCSGGMGLILVNSANLTATGNTFHGNGGTNTLQAQIFLGGKAGGRPGKDWETGAAYAGITENITLKNNVFADAAPGQFVFATYLSGNDWSRFSGSFSSNNNVWSDAGSTMKFSMSGNKLTDLRGWQGNTGEDMASSWSSQSQAPNGGAAPAPSFTDFHINLDKRSYTATGGTATIKLQVNSFGAGTVSLSVAGLPGGVTASYSQNSLISGAPVLTLSVPQPLNQTVPVTIIASSGARVHTVNFNVHL